MAGAESIAMMYVFVLLVFGTISLFLGLKRPSDRRKIKDAARVEKFDLKRREAIHDDVAVIGKIGPAEAAEQSQTETIKQKTSLLDRLFSEEKRVLRQSLELIKGSSEQRQGRGLPEGQIVINLCDRENDLLSQVKDLVAKPESISERIKKSTRSMGKQLHKLTHKTDAAEREAEHDGAESRAEEQRLHKEDHLDRLFEDKLLAIAINENHIEKELESITHNARKIMSINDQILAIARSDDSKKSEKEKDVGVLSKDLHTKLRLMQEISVSLKVITVDEERIKTLLHEEVDLARKENKAA